MIQFIRRLLHAVVIQLSPQSVLEPQVTVGAIYRLDSDKSNPFDRVCMVTVKDVQSGWVLYAMHPVGTGLFQNESKTIRDFLAIYRAV